MNEALIRKCLRIYKYREDSYYADAQKFKLHGKLDQYDSCMTAAMAYNSAYTMLEYAINGNDECLSQFDDFMQGKASVEG